jgi:hypothetical protein
MARWAAAIPAGNSLADHQSNARCNFRVVLESGRSSNCGTISSAIALHASVSAFCRVEPLLASALSIRASRECRPASSRAPRRDSSDRTRVETYRPSTGPPGRRCRFRAPSSIPRNVGCHLIHRVGAGGTSEWRSREGPELSSGEIPEIGDLVVPHRLIQRKCVDEDYGQS